MTTPEAAVMLEAAPDRSPERAASVWQRLSGQEPASIETLKQPKRKSAVYLLRFLTGPKIVAKHARAQTLVTEHAIYSVLDNLPVTSPRCAGLVREPDGDYAWLFTEYVEGVPYAESDARHRQVAARWLSAVHLSAIDARAELPARGLDHYRDVLLRAEDTIRMALDNAAFDVADRSTLQTIASRCRAILGCWSAAEEIANVLPPTLVHGGFGTKNVRIGDAGESAVYAFDWEAGGWGTPASDLSSVDLDAYHASVSAVLPQTTREHVQKLALLGRLLKAYSSIPGEARSLASAWPSRVMAKMRVYERRIGEAQTALRWGE